MNTMHVSRWLMVSPEGPETCAKNGDLVHLRQGDADGACGPYALMMALITLGALERAEVSSMNLWDGRSREGKFRNALISHGALISSGTNGEDLATLGQHFRGSGIDVEHLTGSKKQLVNELCNALSRDGIPLIGVSWSKHSGHWMMVVGHQGYEHEGHYRLTHLLCLDPGAEAPKAALWNAVIEVFTDDGLSVSRGIYSSNHWGMDGHTSACKLDEAIVLESNKE